VRGELQAGWIRLSCCLLCVDERWMGGWVYEWGV
jgi:hypothetical protein